MTIEQRARRACAVLGWHFRGDGTSDRDYVTRHRHGDTFVLHDREGNETMSTVDALELAAVLRDAGDLDIGERTVSASAAAVLAHDRRSLWRIDILNPSDGEWRVSVDGEYARPFYAESLTADELAVRLAARQQLEDIQSIVAWNVEVTSPGAADACVVKVEANQGHGGASHALADLAAQWREHLTVLADWMLEHGEIGPVAMADLRGWQIDVVREAQAVATIGGPTGEPASADVHRWLTERWSWWAYGRSACPHVPAILTERPGVVRWIDEMLEGGGGGPGTNPSIEVLMMFDQQTEECVHCRGAGTIGADGPRVRRHLPCQHCNGLGRVRGDA